jgi:hypothetical protein
MKAQWLALWADAKAWMQAHLAITCLSVAVVLLILIAWAR